MISTRHLGARLYREIRLHLRPLLSLHVYFAILVVALLAPVTGWLLTATLYLSGESMIGNEDLLRFVVTPAGLVWLLVSGSLGVLLIFLQHAGMMLIAARDDASRATSAWIALWQMARRLPVLLELALLQVGVHLLLAGMLVVNGWMYVRWMFALPAMLVTRIVGAISRSRCSGLRSAGVRLARFAHRFW